MKRPLLLLLCLAGCAGSPEPRVPPLAAVVVAAGAGEMDIGEGRVRILADKGLTGGGWAALERTEPPGTRTSLHRHNRMDEAFYVVGGTFSVFVDGKLHRLRPGGFVFIPRRTPHAQGNSSDGPVKILSLFSPAGWEESARDRAALHSRHPAGTPEFSKRIAEVFARHDIEILGPSPIPAPDD